MLKIKVKVKPQAKKENVEKIGENEFKVSVKEPAKENKANFAVIEALAEYFGTSISQISLVSGKASKEKIFEIENMNKKHE